MFASLLCIMLFADEWPREAPGLVRLSGTTDNLGNTAILHKLMTSKFPGIVILSEMAAQLKQRRMLLNLGWAPRDQNEQADALTNDAFQEFSPSRRIHVDPATLEFLVLGQYTRVAEHLYQETKKAKELAPAMRLKRRRRAAGSRLRDTHPW